MIIRQLRKTYVSGLSVLGGEPLEKENLPEVIRLVRTCRELVPEKTIWLYTSCLFDDLVESAPELLSDVDVLVDGPYLESRRDLTLRFRGSANQRIIDVKASIESGKIVLWDKKGEKR